MKLVIPVQDDEIVRYHEIDESKLYEIDVLHIGLGKIDCLTHEHPQLLSEQRRIAYIRKIIDCFKIIKKKEVSGDDDRTYILARWLQESILVPHRKQTTTSKEVYEILGKSNLETSDVMGIIMAGLKDRSRRAQERNEIVTIIKNGIQ